MAALGAPTHVHPIHEARRMVELFEGSGSIKPRQFSDTGADELQNVALMPGREREREREKSERPQKRER